MSKNLIRLAIVLYGAFWFRLGVALYFLPDDAANGIHIGWDLLAIHFGVALCVFLEVVVYQFGKSLCTYGLYYILCKRDDHRVYRIVWEQCARLYHWHKAARNALRKLVGVDEGRQVGLKDNLHG